MIVKQIPYFKVKLTETVKVKYYNSILENHLNYLNSNMVQVPISAIYDNQKDIYLVYNGNERTIGHKLNKRGILVSIIEQNDDFESFEGSMYRLGEEYRNYENIIFTLNKKFTRANQELQNKLKSGEISKSVYDLLV